MESLTAITNVLRIAMVIFIYLVSSLNSGVEARLEWTRTELCRLVPSPTERAALPENVPLLNTTFKPFVYRQRIALISYFPHRAVLVSTVEDPRSSNSPELYILEAMAESGNPVKPPESVGHFKSPSSNVVLRRCDDDVGVHVAIATDVVEEGNGLRESGLTFEWVPPHENEGLVDIWITKLEVTKSYRRQRRRRNRQF